MELTVRAFEEVVLTDLHHWHSTALRGQCITRPRRQLLFGEHGLVGRLPFRRGYDRWKACVLLFRAHWGHLGVFEQKCTTCLEPSGPGLRLANSRSRSAATPCNSAGSQKLRYR